MFHGSAKRSGRRSVNEGRRKRGGGNLDWSPILLLLKQNVILLPGDQKKLFHASQLLFNRTIDDGLPPNLAPVVQRPDNFIQWISHFIIWLAPRAGKMSQIVRCDWLPERARWSYLARSVLPVARSLGIESLIPTTMRLFFDFLVVLGKNAH